MLDGKFIRKRIEMKAGLFCMPCVMKQAYSSATRATTDEKEIKKIMDMTADYVKIMDFNSTPADVSNYVYRISRKITGNPDPYLKDKRHFNGVCLSLVPELEKIIENSSDPLKTASKLSVIGNIIDLGINNHFDLKKDIGRLLDKPFGVDDFEKFREFINGERKKILYIGDNAGEIVFDKMFIKQFKDAHDVVFVVKSGPVINDSTMDDALYVGMTDLVKVIETGADGIGVEWKCVSQEFINHYRDCDFVVSKGQGNFETLFGKEKKTFFLLKAKCEYVADILGTVFGEVVFEYREK